MRSKSIQAWSGLLIASITASLAIFDPEDRVRPFYRDITDEDFGKIDSIIERLFALVRVGCASRC